MDIYVLSSFVLLWIKLLWTFLYKSFCRHIFLFLLATSRIRISRLQGRYNFNFIRKGKIFAKVIAKPMFLQYIKISVFHILSNIWFTPSQGACTCITLCQVHSSLAYLCGLFTHILWVFSKVIFSDQPSLLLVFNVSLRASTMPPTSNPVSLTSLNSSENLCASQFVYSPQWIVNSMTSGNCLCFPYVSV